MLARLIPIALLCTTSILYCDHPKPAQPQGTEGCKAQFYHSSWCPIEVDVSVAFDDFRSLPEGSWNGNMGAFAALNLKADLPRSFGLQLGGSYGLYDWNGRSSTPYKNSHTLQQQGFITAAFSWETPCDSGVKAAFAFDCMFNKNFGLFAVNPFLDQIRGQLGYLFLTHHEIGAWATYGIHKAHETAQELPLKFRGIAQANLFYCYYFSKGGYAMAWGGSPYRRGLMFHSGRPGMYTLGARLSAPLSKCWTLFGHAAFMGGRSTAITSKSTNNASDVCVGITYSFGHRKIQQTPYTAIADNSNFLVDTNQNS
jgi:hypothetical protein